MAPELTAVITFHREGVLAHAALRSYLLSCAKARETGIFMEVVLVLDTADDETISMVCDHPDLVGDEIVVRTDVADSAQARNLGIAQSSGKFVCTLDGDDLVSRDYFQRHVEFARTASERTILHAQVVVSFGMDHRYSWQIDQRTMPFSKDMLISENPWVSAVFARREVFQEIPYVPCFPHKTGFGYEDWHWNCQSVAAGYEHVAVPGTAYFYRLKQSGSINTVNSALKAVMPPSALFGPWELP